MPETAVTANFNEALDIKVNFFPEVTLNLILPVNNLPETVNLIFSKTIRFGISTNTCLGQNPPAQLRTNTIDIL